MPFFRVKVSSQGKDPLLFIRDIQYRFFPEMEGKLVELSEFTVNRMREIIKENKYLKSVITDLKKSITNNSESEITNKVKENDLTKKFEDAKNTILSYFK